MGGTEPVMDAQCLGHWVCVNYVTAGNQLFTSRQLLKNFSNFRRLVLFALPICSEKIWIDGLHTGVVKKKRHARAAQ